MNPIVENQLCARFNPVSIGSDAAAPKNPIRKADTQQCILAVRTYAGMVYGTSQRLLGEDEIALDSTRAAFLHWLGNARDVECSPCSWLHRAAVAQARSLLADCDDEWTVSDRRDKSKRGNGSDWSRVSPVLDDALAGLDDDCHSVLVRHYLQGQMLGEIALDDRDSRPAVICRVERALEQLRERLKAGGVSLPMATLEIQMRKAVTAAPAFVLSELSRLILGAWTQPGIAHHGQGMSATLDSQRGLPAIP